MKARHVQPAAFSGRPLAELALPPGEKARTAGQLTLPLPECPRHKWHAVGRDVQRCTTCGALRRTLPPNYRKASKWEGQW